MFSPVTFLGRLPASWSIARPWSIAHFLALDRLPGRSPIAQVLFMQFAELLDQQDESLGEIEALRNHCGELCASAVMIALTPVSTTVVQ